MSSVKDTKRKKGVSKAESCVTYFLSNVVGEDPKREGLLDTPRRVVAAWKEMTSGYNTSLKDVFTSFDNGENYDELITMCNIDFSSVCEHHLLPFYGVAHVSYLPKEQGRVVGASKLVRLVEVYAARLQLQENIGQQVVGALMGNPLNARGAACVIEAKHMCMFCRGVKSRRSVMVTASLRGECKTNATLRAEIYNHIKLTKL